MKILLTIFVKIPHNVIEVMVVLMVLLLALKFVQSGVYHACVGGHDIVYTPSFCWGEGGGVEPPNFLKGEAGLTRSQFLERFFWETGGDLSQGVAIFT